MDNNSLHNIRPLFEYESLLTQDIINFYQLQACQNSAFRHVFAWPHKELSISLLIGLLQDNSEKKGLISA